MDKINSGSESSQTTSFSQKEFISKEKENPITSQGSSKDSKHKIGSPEISTIKDLLQKYDNISNGSSQIYGNLIGWIPNKIPRNIKIKSTEPTFSRAYYEAIPKKTTVKNLKEEHSESARLSSQSLELKSRGLENQIEDKFIEHTKYCLGNPVTCYPEKDTYSLSQKSKTSTIFAGSHRNSLAFPSDFSDYDGNIGSLWLDNYQLQKNKLDDEDEENEQENNDNHDLCIAEFEQVLVSLNNQDEIELLDLLDNIDTLQFNNLSTMGLNELQQDDDLSNEGDAGGPGPDAADLDALENSETVEQDMLNLLMMVGLEKGMDAENDEADIFANDDGGGDDDDQEQAEALANEIEEIELEIAYENEMEHEQLHQDFLDGDLDEYQLQEHLENCDQIHNEEEYDLNLNLQEVEILENDMYDDQQLNEIEETHEQTNCSGPGSEAASDAIKANHNNAEYNLDLINAELFDENNQNLEKDAQNAEGFSDEDDGSDGDEERNNKFDGQGLPKTRGKLKEGSTDDEDDAFGICIYEIMDDIEKDEQAVLDYYC